MTPEAAAEAVNPDGLVELLQEAIRIPSVTPHEAEFAQWVHEQLLAAFGTEHSSRCVLRTGPMSTQHRLGEPASSIGGCDIGHCRRFGLCSSGGVFGALC